MTPHLRVGQTIRRPGTTQQLLIVEVTDTTIYVVDLYPDDKRSPRYPIDLSQNPFLHVVEQHAEKPPT